MLFSDVFRDYEADYSAGVSAEEVEEEEEEEGEDEEEEGKNVVTDTLHASSLKLASLTSSLILREYFYSLN